MIISQLYWLLEPSYFWSICLSVSLFALLSIHMTICLVLTQPSTLIAICLAVIDYLIHLKN